MRSNVAVMLAHRLRRWPNKKPVWGRCFVFAGYNTGADPEGGAGGARPPVFVPNYFKSPLNWPKYARKLAPEPPAPPPFSNPGSAPVIHLDI